MGGKKRPEVALSPQGKDAESGVRELLSRTWHGYRARKILAKRRWAWSRRQKM